MVKIVCVLYDDPVTGYPESYSRDSIPSITHYPDKHGKPGQTAPNPVGIDSHRFIMRETYASKSEDNKKLSVPV